MVGVIVGGGEEQTEFGVDGVGKSSRLQAASKLASPRRPHQVARARQQLAKRVEHAATLLLPTPLAQTILDPALAIAQTLLYCGIHLKSFAHFGDLASFPLVIFRKCRWISRLGSQISRRTAADSLVLGLVVR
jgi:hypothetical protein